MVWICIARGRTHRGRLSGKRLASGFLRNLLPRFLPLGIASVILVLIVGVAPLLGLIILGAGLLAAGRSGQVTNHLTIGPRPIGKAEVKAGVAVDVIVVVEERARIETTDISILVRRAAKRGRGHMKIASHWGGHGLLIGVQRSEEQTLLLRGENKVVRVAGGSHRESEL